MVIFSCSVGIPKINDGYAIIFNLCRMETATQPTKRVLIITYYWPPSGGSGVQRWLKMSKYLPEAGWQPVIYTPENPDFDRKDPSLLDEIHPDTVVLRRKIWEPTQVLKMVQGKGKQTVVQGKVGSSKSFMAKLMVWIRGNIFIPDARVYWVKPSVRYLRQYLKENPVDAIITSGPPHSMHLIGRGLKRALGTTWVADFRDSWSSWDVLDDLSLSERSRAKHAKLEQSIFQEADLVWGVNEMMQEEFEGLGAPRVSELTNGYDPADFTASEDTWPDKFRLSHVGTLSGYRIPSDAFCEALTELCTEIYGFAEALELTFLGDRTPELEEIWTRFPQLKEKVKMLDPIPHHQVMSAYQKSAVLLLFLNTSAYAPVNSPGKLFEYLAAQRPVLCIGDVRSMASRILHHTQAGESVEREDKAEFKAVFRKFFEDHQAKRPLQSINVEEYSRPNLAKKAAGVLDSLLK